MASASLRALLKGAIDYAGLFPPANLALEPALQDFAEYVRSGDSWMLGAFVLPVQKFEEASGNLGKFDVVNRLRLSALGPKTETPAEFMSALNSSAAAIRSFETRYGASAGISQIEMALPAQAGVSVADAGDVLSGVKIPVFWEAPADDAERVIDFLANHKRDAMAPGFGFKLRTGGVIASAFPSAIQIARALVAAVKMEVPIKFTAGLHHPVRRFHPSVQAKMHGFLNVLGAGVLAAEHGWKTQQVAAMLEDEDASAFVFDDDAFAWRDWKIAVDRIAAQRALVTSLGSCSFDEPRDDLRELQLF